MELNLLASFSEVMGYIGYVLLAVLVLLIMITVHEFGHYSSGKLLGFSIEEFSIGFGPKLYQKKKKDGELFSVRLLPLGGYCAFLGEDKDLQNPKAFNNKNPFKRIIVLFSGAFMNYLFAVIIIAVMFGAYGQTALVGVDMVDSNEYPKEYSLQSKDIILSVEGKSVYLISDLMDGIENRKKGDKVEFTVRRGGKDTEVLVMLRADTDFSNLEDVSKLYNALGISYQLNDKGEVVSSGLYSTTVRFGFFKTIANSFDYSIKLAGTIFSVLGQLLTGRLSISSMGGTVTTIAVTADAIKVGGLRYLLNITSFIGVNLAVFNLLPFPALDGSRIVFCLIEGIFKKPVNRKVEGVIHTIGLVFILLFAVIFDLQRCF